MQKAWNKAPSSELWKDISIDLLRIDLLGRATEECRQRYAELCKNRAEISASSVLRVPQDASGSEIGQESLSRHSSPYAPRSPSHVPRLTRHVMRKSTLNRTSSPLGRASAQIAEVSLREVETPSSKRNIHDNVRAMLAGNLDGDNEDKAKVHHPQ